MFEWVQSMDDAIVAGLQTFGTDPFGILWQAVTFVGHPLLWFMLAAVLYWNQRENESFFLVNLLVLSMAATAVVKTLVLRPRPPLHFNITPEPSWLSSITTTFANRFSFPSGHTTLITTLVAFYWNKLWKNSKIVAGTAVILVGLSRMILGQHFLSDVLGGFVLGIILALIAGWFSAKLESHHFKLSKIDDAIGLIGIMVIGMLTIAFFEAPAVFFGLLGYYAGFFLGKEIEFTQSKISPQRSVLKSVSGALSSMIWVVAGVFWASGYFQIALFFLAGFWATFLFPWLYEKTLSKYLFGKTTRGKTY